MKNLLASIASLFVVAAFGYEVPSGWMNDFVAATNEAARTHKPLVMYWGHQGCTSCDAFTLTVQEASFKVWMDERPYIFCYVRGANHHDFPENEGAMEFAMTAAGKRDSLSKYPFVCLYRVKESGAVQAKNFSGLYTKYYMPVYKETFAESISASIDEYFESYLSGDELYFDVADTDDDRFEVEPDTEWVDIPVYRKDTRTEASESRLRVNFSDGPSISQTIEWNGGQTFQLVRVNLVVDGFTFQAGKRISLTLYNQQDEEQAKTYIYQVAEKENGPLNPYWMGERTADTLQFGEWTMDLEAATNLAAKTEGACTIMFFTGALWCPHCRPLETNVFETARFKEWARTNKVALVIADNPRRSPNDNYAQYAANGYADVSCVPNGAAPTLLRYARGSNGCSGASYRTRKMIEDADAEAVLARNHAWGYPGGFFHAPSSFRTGYPTLILLDANGRIRGRFTANESADRQYDLDENMARFASFIRLAADGDADGSYAASTPLVHAVGEATDTSLSLHQSARVFRLDGLREGVLKVNLTKAAARDVAFTLQRVRDINLRHRDADGKIVRSEDYSVAVDVASGANSLSFDVSPDETNYLRVSSFADGRTEFYGTAETAFDVSFSSEILIEPTDAHQSDTSTGNPLNFTVSKDGYYLFTGFTSVTGDVVTVDAERGFYKGTADGTAIGVSTNGAIICFRTWKPGTIAFEAAQQRMVTTDGTGIVKVVRTGGAAGPANVRVYSDGSPVVTNRTGWTDTVLAFADGETEKTVSFPLYQGMDVRPDETFTLALTSADAAEPKADVSDAALVITVCDTTEPSFAQDSYSVDCWRRFGSESEFVLRNVGADTVSLRIASGRLPPGMKLVVENGSAVLKGLPTKSGTYTFSCQVRDKGEDGTVYGRVATFTVNVKEPSESNPFVGRALSSRELPLLVGTDSGKRVVAGVLTVAANSKNKVSAKYRGTESKTITFSGTWDTIDSETGAVSCELVKGGHALSLSLGSDGRLDAELVFGKDGLSYFADAGDTLTGSSSDRTDDSFAPFKGNYSVQLSNADTEGVDLALTGGGVLRLRMTTSSAVRRGTVSYAGYMPDGRSFSGAAPLAVRDDGTAELTVFKRASPAVIGVPLVLLPGAADAWDTPDVLESQQLVWTADDMAGYHLRREGAYWEVLTQLDAWGGVYNALRTDHICNLFGYLPGCALSFDASRLATGTRGAVVSLPSAVATARSSGFGLSDKEGGTLTMSFSKSSGQFSGRAQIRFADGTKTTGTYRGILLPGWASCSDCGFDIVTRPFGYGLLYFKDKVAGDDGRTHTVTRSLPVTLTAAFNE